MVRTRKAPADRRAQILQATFDLVTQQGYQSVSMRDVAARCGISKAAIYVYFPTKEALYNTVIQNALALRLQLIEAALTPDLPVYEQLFNVLHAVFHLTAYKSESMTSLIELSHVYAEADLAAHKLAIVQMLTDIIATGEQQGGIQLPVQLASASDAAHLLIDAATGVAGTLDMHTDAPVDQQLRQKLSQLTSTFLCGWQSGTGHHR
ncbi:HTH-type transcriptional regulator RutR [BD1-7 clade bacterium]|uniref:HTH-type transcriptional regulator RutR n=1 Tax=BD1-7 clade bacterium TaxID=2029982 RepID=A0A5S9NZN7_9GAMM|nr:HTH-type transcriptional regulator RutR [BD1-7 clade bacterium]CAA0096192.1 HTH-type transcriptional regulator RutR [BD1-7 clade bacterium]